MRAGRVCRWFSATLLLECIYGAPILADGEAPNKIACIAADTDGQSLRLEGKLLAARKRFGVCASTSCPKIVREDCLERIDEVQKAQPTLLFSATNGNGRSVTEVRVLMDGVPLAERLDGRPLAVDPGEHLFTFTAVGRTNAEMRLSIDEGEKDRHGIVLRTAGADPLAASVAPVHPDGVVTGSSSFSAQTRSNPASSPLARNDARGSRPAMSPAPFGMDSNRIAALTVGGAGILGVGVGSIFGLLTLSKWNAAQRDCGPACPANSLGQTEASTASTDGTISNLAFILGGAALATGAALWFLAPEPSSSQTEIRVVPTVGPRHGEIALERRF